MNRIEKALSKKISVAGVYKYPKDLIPSDIIKKIDGNIKEAKGITSREMPDATFTFAGITDSHIYFTIVAKKSQVDEQQKKDIQQKTRFEALSIREKAIYKGVFRMSIM